MIKGIIQKMTVQLQEQVNYQLNLSESIAMNELIGSSIRMEWTGGIFCSNCGKQTKTSFGQGFCYPCFQSAPQAAPCIIRPELCRAHLGEGRDIDWEEKHHNQPHIVYLAASDTVKVGVTRFDQQLTRWIDQGASQAIIVAVTPNRYTAGLIEVTLKDFMSDKTNWQRMLKNELDDSIDLLDEKGKIEDLLPFDLRDFIADDDTVLKINYPVTRFPTKVKSVGFDKSPIIEGELIGIKGQYLIFSDDRVINMRKHTSYEISFSKK